MADIFTKEKRSEVMGKIRAKHTKPEMIVRKYLFSQGFRYRLHQKNLPGSPDIVLKRYNTAVIINGCFWHGHDACDTFKMPKTRVEFWNAKINRNRERDSNDFLRLKKLGWKVITVWECELKKNEKDKTLENLKENIIHIDVKKNMEF
ncbi:very short patch repair endonuclease [Ferruginibacter sp. HRS2-29]|uniref:very short patch repair endonuclease n=1 Tax=Ferruginibacter sp. HRS2-29 TaxID=2487334 RepID=UPI0020CF4040|nr:DNA mismatch endonuclease Vsr [Ferruginibacter sp. HRS2-29]MCP9750451.1 DNA mismatch endonuclease Vsr [Ferruginibacter sp. HRS2-29]